MEWLKRKELGLPIWAWVVIAAVILFVYLVIAWTTAPEEKE